MLGKELNLHVCPIMIHLNASDFNVCRSEEVIIKFLLTLSVLPQFSCDSNEPWYT